MRADRLLIAAGLFLGFGLWFLFAFCHGNVGIGFALPVAGTKFNMDTTTMGVPALVGIPLTIVGILLLAVALIAAIIEQFRPHSRMAESAPRRRDDTFES